VNAEPSACRLLWVDKKIAHGVAAGRGHGGIFARANGVDHRPGAGESRHLKVLNAAANDLKLAGRLMQKSPMR